MATTTMTAATVRWMSCRRRISPGTISAHMLIQGTGTRLASCSCKGRLLSQDTARGQISLALRKHYFDKFRRNTQTGTMAWARTRCQMTTTTTCQCQMRQSQVSRCGVKGIYQPDGCVAGVCGVVLQQEGPRRSWSAREQVTIEGLSAGCSCPKTQIPAPPGSV